MSDRECLTMKSTLLTILVLVSSGLSLQAYADNSLLTRDEGKSYRGFRCEERSSEPGRITVSHVLELVAKGTVTDIGFPEFDLVETTSRSIHGTQVDQKSDVILVGVYCLNIARDNPLIVGCVGFNPKVPQSGFPKGAPVQFSTELDGRKAIWEDAVVDSATLVFSANDAAVRLSNFLSSECSAK